ncbi:MAG TPA: DUF1203 domain-containing protein [Opitutus sp.]|nr:DUF1203 domain-containing protein [Opitutus sp.]
MPATAPFRIVPLAGDVAARARRTLRDDHGHALRVVTAVESAPCRLTLRQIQPGERAILMSYSPFAGDHPYREIGPIFIRADDAAAYGSPDRWPSEIDPTTRVFRAYNAAEEIIDARVGTATPETLIADLFSNPATDCLHVRSLTHGCYTFKIARA